MATAMAEDAAQRRVEQTDRANHHIAAQRRSDEEESAKARVLIDRFVAQATEAGLATEELTARPWSGRGRYRTGVERWYLLRDRSVGVGVAGSYYVLVAAPGPLGRRRRARRGGRRGVVPAPRPLGGRGGGRELLRPRRGAGALRPLADRRDPTDPSAAPGGAGCSRWRGLRPRRPAGGAAPP